MLIFSEVFVDLCRHLLLYATAKLPFKNVLHRKDIGHHSSGLHQGHITYEESSFNSFSVQNLSMTLCHTFGLIFLWKAVTWPRLGHDLAITWPCVFNNFYNSWINEIIRIIYFKLQKVERRKIVRCTNII